MPAARRAGGGRAAPAGGVFARSFARNLKQMPSGALDRDLFLKTFHSLPEEKVAGALAQASPRERALLLSSLPADVASSVRQWLPPVMIGPARLPPPAPSPLPAPPGGPRAEILTTNYANVPAQLAETDPTGWNRALTDGKTVQDWSIGGPNFFEWSPVYDRTCTFEREGGLENPVVGATGWAIPSQNAMGLSGKDVWFTHPWWFDWEYYIALDPQFQGLLAPDGANRGVDPTKSPGDPGYISDPDYNNALHIAEGTGPGELGLSAPLGCLGVEIDQDLVPPAFRASVEQGTRIATFGRWIVDSGHPDFHTEIHPPLLMATATPSPPPSGVPGAGVATHVELMSRPYTSSQKYSEGNFIDHLVAEVAKVETPIFGFPGSWRVEAHPAIYPVPYVGRPWLEFFVRPTTPPSNDPLRQQVLMVQCHFTVRKGVAVWVYQAGDDTVGVSIVLGDLNPAPLPKKHDYSVSWSELGSEYAWIVGIWGLLETPLDPLGLAILERGILTDRYDPPLAVSGVDTTNVAGPMQAGQLTSAVGWAEDDTQPFPIYGWLDVFWATSGPVVEGPAD